MRHLENVNEGPNQNLYKLILVKTQATMKRNMQNNTHRTKRDKSDINNNKDMQNLPKKVPQTGSKVP